MKSFSKIIGVVALVFASSVFADKPAETQVVNVNPDALRALIATADHLTVTKGEWEHEKKLYETSDPADIKAFNDALHPKVPESVYACLCGATVTVYVYKGGKQLEKIQYIAPDEVVTGSWNSYTHISKPRDLVSWFEARGIHEPELGYQAYYSVGETKGSSLVIYSYEIA